MDGLKSNAKLNLILTKFKKRNRDFIFLIDQFSFADTMSKYEMQKRLKQIFDDHVMDEDRVCLIKFNDQKYTRTVFSLVEKGPNRT